MSTTDTAIEALVNSATNPERQHPKTDFTLSQAVTIAVGNATVAGDKPPTTLAEVRKTLRDMERSMKHVWLTGMAALDLLDAELDGRDLSASCRFP